MLEPEQRLSDPPPNGTMVPEVVKPANWRARLWDWLEHAGKRVGVPVLVLSSLSLVVAIVSLCVGIANYRWNMASDRPILNSNGFKTVSQAQDTVVTIDLTNVGKKTGRRGIATFFAIDSGAGVPSKIGSAKIVGAGTSIFAAYGASATITMQDRSPPGLFLVYAFYFDEPGAKYEQAFEFERGSADPSSPTVVRYDELAPPDLKMCSSR